MNYLFLIEEEKKLRKYKNQRQIRECVFYKRNEGTNLYLEACLLGEKPRERIAESWEEIVVNCIDKGVDDNRS